MKPSKILLDEMREMLDRTEEMLRDDSLPTATQISDTNTFCWVMVGILKQLQESVSDELSDL